MKMVCAERSFFHCPGLGLYTCPSSKLGRLGTTRQLSESRKTVKPRVVLLENVVSASMPSVDMRRTTRVFGVVKGVDGARVLRSGRRLWPDSGDIKVRRPNDVDDWLSLTKNNKKGDGGDLGCKTNCWSYNSSPKQDKLVPEVPSPKLVEAFDSGDDPNSDKMFGIVYNRKRKRSAIEGSKFPVTLDSPIEDRMLGRQFVRRRRRKIDCQNLDGAQNMDTQCSFFSKNMVSVVMESSQCRTDKGALFLYSVLSYLTRTKLSLAKLSAFLLSEPINSVYSSFGIRVSGTHVKNSGSCQIFGAVQHVPMFSVDFSAVPFCYMYIHSCMLLKYKFKSLEYVSDKKNHCEGNLMVVPSKKDILDERPEPDHSENGHVQHSSVRLGSSTQKPDHSENRHVEHSSVRHGSSTQNRNGSVRGTQKRSRSSIRRKPRNPSLIGGHNRNGSLFSSLRNLQRDATRGARDLKVSSSRCCFNILVIEADKCYREEGANVLFELSPSGEWLLVVKKNGLTRFSLKAENDTRLHCSNRFTHATVWNVDSSRKLEFTSKKDWAIFKDLYKECLDRNTQPSVKAIPVPGVCEVPGYGAGCSVPFIRPDSYISINGDEISRAMDKRSAIYDMDSEDDDWLSTLNNSDCSENEIKEHVSKDNFELMIDVFEKVLYGNPSGSSIDEKAAIDLCQGLGGKEVVDSVYGYWMKKRKKRKRPLLRIFQGPAKKPPFIPKPDLSKKTPSKRQSSRLRRGKNLDLQRAIEAHQKQVQEAEVQFEEAKASANIKTEIAISKRKKAQILMENADVATYKATIAVRISEAARVAESPNAAAAHFLDLTDSLV